MTTKYKPKIRGLEIILHQENGEVYRGEISSIEGFAYIPKKDPNTVILGIEFDFNRKTKYRDNLDLLFTTDKEEDIKEFIEILKQLI